MTDPLAATLHRLFRAYFWLRRPLTVGVRGLVQSGGRVLLVRHTYMPGWFFPGGGVDKGETLNAAIRRELIEEVGVHFTGEPELIGAYSSFREYKSDHIVFFRIGAFAMRPARNGEIAEYGFFPLESPPPGASPGTLRRIAELRGEAPKAAIW